MAEQLTLVKRADMATADIGTLSLFNYTDGIEIKQGGMSPMTFSPGDEIAIDTYTVEVRGTSTDNLADKLNQIDQKIIEADNFRMKPAEPYGIWLRDQLASETGARQTFVTSMSRSINDAMHDKYPVAQSHQLIDVDLAIERMPWYESTSIATVTLGSLYALNNYRAGTVLLEPISGFVGGTFLSHGTTDNHPVGTSGCVVHYNIGTTWYTATANPSSGTIVGTGLSSSYIVFSTGAMQMCGGDAGQPWLLDYTYSGGSAGVTIAATGPTSHDFPSRIARTDIIGIDGYGTIEELWAGFRTANYGATANFVGLWEAELVTFSTDTAATADAGATGGSAMAITFATDAAMAYRSVHRVFSYTSNYTDQRGEFDVIARARITSGTANMRMDAGLIGAIASTRTGEPIAVTSTYWKYYNLGRLTIPAIPPGFPSNPTSFDAFVYSGFQFYAQRVAGTGQLWVDHFILVPVSEGYLHLDGMTAHYATTDEHFKTSVFVAPKGESSAWNFINAVFSDVADSSGVSLDTWNLPNDAALLILAAQRAGTVPTLDTQLTIRMAYYNRWRTLRGAT